MTLGFSTKFKDGMRTNFVEKIWASYVDKGFELPEFWPGWYGLNCVYDFDGNNFADIKPKLHTMREDIHDKWRAGMNIHPVIGNRSANRFQFAPTISCVSVQEIYMTYFCGRLEMSVDDKYLYKYDIEKLIASDGFDSEDTFIKWFFPYDQNKWFGKIIHWTDLKY